MNLFAACLLANETIGEPVTLFEELSRLVGWLVG